MSLCHALSVAEKYQGCFRLPAELTRLSEPVPKRRRPFSNTYVAGKGVGVPVAAALGVTVTAEVGVPVTAALGVPVTAAVGVSVAAAVGVSVAAAVGVSVTAAVGVAVTAAVGVSVTAAVGVAVAAAVGVPVTAAVGVSVAAALGVAEAGALVWLGVLDAGAPIDGVAEGRGEYAKPLDAPCSTDEMVPMSDKGPAP